jgi:hypothetical protein
MPTLNVVQDERHPLAVVEAAQQPRRRQLRRQSGGDGHLTAVQLRCACVHRRVDSLDEPRRPSAVRTRSAVPGEKPPGWDTATTTGAPSTASTAARTASGRSSHEARTPAAVTTAPIIVRSPPTPRTRCRNATR